MQEFPSDPPEKPWWQRWMVLIFLFSIVGCIAYCCIFPGLLGEWTPKVRYNDKVSTQVIDDYLSAMATKDSDLAVNFLATNNSMGFSKKDLDSQLEGVNYSLYSGYQSIEVTYSRLQRGSTDDAYSSYAHIEGDIMYRLPIDYYQSKGFFIADLVKIGNNWKIDRIEIFVSPEKVEQDQNKNE